MGSTLSDLIYCINTFLRLFVNHASYRSYLQIIIIIIIKIRIMSLNQGKGEVTYYC